MPTPTNSSSYSLKNTYYHKKSLRPKKLVFSNDSAEVCYDEKSRAWGCLGLVVLIFICLFDNRSMGFIIYSIIAFFYLFSIIRHSDSSELLPVFDKLHGRFYPKGWSIKSSFPINEIDHLQILEIENLHDISYELNAFMKDGNRFQIIEHVNYSNFIANAKRLAEFLALPLKDKHGEPFEDLPGKFKGPLVPLHSVFQKKHLVFRQDSINIQTTWDSILATIFVSIILLFGGLSLFWWGLFAFDSIIWSAVIMGSFGAIVFFIWFCNILKKASKSFFDIADSNFYPNGFTHDGLGIPLSQIDHLEILTEQLITKSKYIYMHELNIVLKDSSRYNITEDRNEKRFLADAHALSARLSIPLVNAWDRMPITQSPSENNNVLASNEYRR